MPWNPISKTLNAGEPAPNLTDYAAARAAFSWADARAELAGLPDGSLNIAFEAVDRWVAAGQGETTALRWLGKNGERRDFSYAELARLSNQFANSLERLGIRPGDRVCILAGRIPELYMTALGTLKAGAVFCPLFSAFGPEPVRVRLANSRARVLVTTSLLYQRKVRPLRDVLPDLEFVLLVDGVAEAPSPLVGEGRGGGVTAGNRTSIHSTPCSTPNRTAALLPAPALKTGRCCTLPAAPRERPRARSMSTKPSSPTGGRAAWRWTCIPATFIGAPPIPVGSPASPTASSRL